MDINKSKIKSNIGNCSDKINIKIKWWQHTVIQIEK